MLAIAGIVWKLQTQKNIPAKEPTVQEFNSVPQIKADDLYSITLPAGWTVKYPSYPPSQAENPIIQEIFATSPDYGSRADKKVEGPFWPVYYHGAQLNITVKKGEECPWHVGEGDAGPDTTVISKKLINVDGRPGIMHEFRSPSTFEGREFDVHVNYRGHNFKVSFLFNPKQYPKGEQFFVDTLNTLQWKEYNKYAGRGLVCTTGTLDTQAWKSFKGSNIELAFKYPQTLNLDQKDGTISLTHKIIPTKPLLRHPCDERGGSPPVTEYEDFHAKIRLFNQSVPDVIRTQDSWLTDDLQGDQFKTDGSVQPFAVGRLNDYLEGFAFDGGVEGCGKSVYFFPIGKQKILRIERSWVTGFAYANDPDFKKLITSRNDFIPEKDARTMFDAMLSTLVTSPPQ